MVFNLIQTRRDLHQIPEIGLEEYKTQAYLLAKLEDLLAGCDFSTVTTWQTGIIVHLAGYAPEKTIGWRTDIDGLPVNEATGLDFPSQHQGRMHACGHDVHMTIALGLIHEIIKRQPKHNLVVLFQPAEENLAGGKLMFEAGALDDCMPDEFYALHVRPDLKVGDIATNTSTLFAGTCEVKMTFTGQGGHAAFPHTAKDALVAASYFITQVQSVVSRSVDPIEGAVVTFGSFHAGTTNNVIAETAHLHGTIRSLTLDMSRHVQERVRAVAEGVAASFDMSVNVELIEAGYLPVENQPDLATNLMAFYEADKEVNLIDIAPAMTGEDFGYLLSKVPGVMFWLGVDTPYPLHHPMMSPKEEAIPFGVEKVSQFLNSRLN
ncbi:N-acetyldiaminopimelate deacetylase [Streptococcus moroccensis]|uniref:N-acetyldiaminopimelate deacetylase n=1 Tax=Streptococcus moroccensis TaxID=1451356 RepID=A0ABT9YPZ3_9STRE|nr:N-acetyldiaminopimelate deacetylase [Streptococcus moroccensis]MDQ0222053.1 N-acetyldiaminopimelate deacetylase [Streptococcus moroccensis]